RLLRGVRRGGGRARPRGRGVAREGLLQRGLLPLRGRDDPDLRRRRLHLGIRPAPLLQARARVRVAARDAGVASRARRARDRAVTVLSIDLSGRVAIVTGGGRGVGRGISESFLEAGAEVVICGRKEPEQTPEAGGRRALFTPADVRELEQIEAVAAFTER